MEVLVGLIGRKSDIPAGWMPIRINERSRLTVPFQRNLLYLPMINQVSPIMRTPLMKKHLFPLSLTKGMAVHTTIICRLVIKNRLFNIVFNTSLINPHLVPHPISGKNTAIHQISVNGISWHIDRETHLFPITLRFSKINRHIYLFSLCVLR